LLEVGALPAIRTESFARMAPVPPLMEAVVPFRWLPKLTKNGHFPAGAGPVVEPVNVWFSFQRISS
jgi:hypothetical protein